MNDRFEGIIRGIVGTERGRRGATVADAFSKVTNTFAKGGALGNSRYPLMLDREGAREYEWRADKWLEIVRDAASVADLPWTAERARDAQRVLESELLADWEDLVDQLRQRATPHNPAKIDELDNAKNLVRARIAHQLDLLVFAEDQTRIPVLEQLGSPRYAAVLLARSRARDLLDASPPDYANAAKEAVSAVEQLARIITRRPTATLGEAIKELRTSSRIQAPLLKGIEEIWAWSSATPGVRHGSSSPMVVNGADARYIVAQSDASLGLLLAADAA